MLGVFAYAVGANLCYSLGWITELLWSGGDTALTLRDAQKYFALALFFVVLTLLPGVFIVIAWALWGFK